MLCIGKSFTNFSSCKTPDFFCLVLLTSCAVCFSVICISYLFILKCSSRCASQDLTGKILLPRKSLLNLSDNINYCTHLVNAIGKIASIEDTICQLYACKPAIIHWFQVLLSKSVQTQGHWHLSLGAHHRKTLWAAFTSLCEPQNIAKSLGVVCCPLQNDYWCFLNLWHT